MSTLFVVVITAVALLFGWGMWTAIERRDAAYGWFMSECQKDLKDYECFAMWRAGNRRR